MSEVKKGNGLVYKNHPLRRVDNLIYYGSMADKYIVLLQILDTKKEPVSYTHLTLPTTSRV